MSYRMVQKYALMPAAALMMAAWLVLLSVAGGQGLTTPVDAYRLDNKTQFSNPLERPQQQLININLASLVGVPNRGAQAARTGEGYRKPVHFFSADVAGLAPGLGIAARYTVARFSGMRLAALGEHAHGCRAPPV